MLYFKQQISSADKSCRPRRNFFALYKFNQIQRIKVKRKCQRVTAASAPGDVPSKGGVEVTLELRLPAMSDEIEIQFRGGNPKKWHSGTVRIEGSLITVTARDGRTKSAQLGRNSPELVARLLLLELDREKPE